MTGSKINFNKIILLDRDEVINVTPNDEKYILKPEDIKFIEKNIKALSKLSSKGFSFIVITNQRCVNTELISNEELEKIHSFIKNELSEKHNINILKFFYCPHKIIEFCECRKPRPGLILEAINEFSLSKNTIMIGDQITDCIAAISAGLFSILIKNDFKDEELDTEERYLGFYQSINEAIPKILRIYN